MAETVFLGDDRAALDREYDNRGKVARHAEYLAACPADSARAREALPTVAPLGDPGRPLPRAIGRHAGLG